MSLVPTQGQSIIIDAPSDGPKATQVAPGSALTSWLVGKFQPWEEWRNRGYQHRWGEYLRMWRGQWLPEDRNRQSERSRLVAPALAQAVEMSVSEIEEALFAKDTWIDIADDIADEEKLDAVLLRDNLMEDLHMGGNREAISEALTNAAIFGTGIVKMNVEVVQNTRPVREGKTQRLVPAGDEEVLVTWESIRPDEFVPDPAGRTIGEMLGCFHKVKKPLHYVLDKIDKGVYLESARQFIGPNGNAGSDSDIDPQDPQSVLQPSEGDEVEIIEYHGKVPVSLLHAASSQRVARSAEGEVLITEIGNPVDQILSTSLEDDMVEAIVTVANQGVLLRAIVNPFTMRDRSIVAFPYEKVPGRFWGRGVCEKGFNPQKALDAEMRARIDALAFVSSPMVAVDGGRMPRGFRMEVKPGKVWITQGPPNEVLQPVKIGDLQPNTFNQTQELERMVAMGTGAFDAAGGITKQGGQASGASSTNLSMMMNAFVKRAKRAITNVESKLIQPLLKQTLWRYMQFAPRRYPTDFKFRIMSTQGIVAREVEAMQLTQLMGMLPEQFPEVTTAVAKGVIDLSSLHNKAEVLQAMSKAMAPPSEEEQQRQKELQDLQFTAVKAEAEGKLLANQETIAKAQKLAAEKMKLVRETKEMDEDKEIELLQLQQEIEQLQILRDQNRIALARVAVEQMRVENEKRKLSQGN